MKDFIPALSLSVIVLAAGCTGSFPPLDAARAASFQPVAAIRIGDESAAQFLRERTARVFSGAKIDAFEDVSHGDTPAARWHLDKSTGDYGVGTATPVDPRGYFLTASHCIGPKPITMLYWEIGASGEKSVHVVLIRDPRIVWQGNLQKHEPDVALLCIDRPLVHSFTWASSFKEHDRVIAAGVTFNEKGMAPAFIGGKIRTSAEEGGSNVPRWVEILHDAPLHAGDSGGPLVTLEGELIGINTGAVSGPLAWMGFPHGGADRPDIEWLRKLIEEDAAQMPGRRRGEVQ